MLLWKPIIQFGGKKEKLGLIVIPEVITQTSIQTI